LAGRFEEEKTMDGLLKLSPKLIYLIVMKI